MIVLENNLKLVEYRNKTYALKFCNTCNIFRPLRAHHCKICDVCIEELGSYFNHKIYKNESILLK